MVPARRWYSLRLGSYGKPALEQPNREFVNDTFVYLPAFYPQKLYVSLPGDADPGAYRFKVVLHDKIAGADFTFERAFTVKPR